MTENKTSATPDPDRVVERLRPRLAELEKERQATRQSAFRWFTTLGVATLVVAIAAAVAMAMQAGNAGAGIGTIPLVGGVVWIMISASRYQARWKERVGRVLIPEVCEAFDADIEYQAEADSSFVKPFNALELIGSWNRGEVKHLLRGEYRGRRFEMVHANLRSRSGGKDSSDHQVFNGLLFRVQTHENFDPGLSIRPNFGWFTKAFGKRAVPTGNEEFDSVFLVSVDDGSALDTEDLNRLLTPDWQHALLRLNEELGTMPQGQSRLNAGLKYDAFYMALTLEEEGRSFGPIQTLRARSFPQVSHVLARESTLEQDLHQLIVDTGTFQRIIDCLHSAER